MASNNKTSKEELKELRQQRSDIIAANTGMAKKHKRNIREVKKILGQDSRTVPEISEATGISSPEVLWYVATLRKYGELVEEGKKGDYFLYGLNPGSSDD